MDVWANIECSPEEPEIKEIDKLGQTLGNIPAHVQQIRELITRFEACHFKYQQHLSNIKASVLTLQPIIDPRKIGSNHIQKGENAWKNDKTGRSLLGQQYLWALNNWITDHPQMKISDQYDQELGQKLTKWLADKNPDKERLVLLLIARLTYDWKSLEILKLGGEYKELEFQVCRMDICHYSFPKHLDSLLQGIGEMKPVKEFEGCGIYNAEIKDYIEGEFSKMLVWLSSKILSFHSFTPSKYELMKVWLVACLAKTLKEQIGLTKPLPKFIV